MGLSTAEKSTPFELLLKIDQYYVDSGIGLPDQKRLQASIWTGVGFRLDQYNFVIGISFLEEILHEPSYTPIPIVKHWFKGVANMRGHLLPVMDLNRLFGVPSVVSQKQRRVMAVRNNEGGYVGFLVDAVYGMQQFSIDNQVTDAVVMPESLRPFISGAYEGEQQKWFVFDTETFMASPQFLMIGQ